METNNIYDTSQLAFVGNFDEQVQEIMGHVRLTREEVENLQFLLDDLNRTFNEVWPGCIVNGFGSIVTGLGIKTSDIDCYIQLPSWLGPTDRSFIIKARNILRRRHWIFQKLFAIVNAKVPIVKFFHAPTKRSCDLNFSSSAGVQNSYLIAYLLKIDKRIMQLSILIKYWSKIHNLTGANLMPNYCLLMMVVFYLQQKSMLPSVLQLQDNTQEYFIDNWNTAFCDVNYVSNDNETLYQLLGGFFKFYNTFKFDKHIISPFIGKPLERNLFLDVQTVPAEFSLYKKNIEVNRCKPIRLDTVLCVQDPFEHNRNCAVAVYPKLANTLKALFLKGTEIYDSGDETSFLKSILLRTVNSQPVVKNKPKKPAVFNKIKKRYKHNQNVRHNVKTSIKQNIFKGKNQRYGR